MKGFIVKGLLMDETLTSAVSLHGKNVTIHTGVKSSAGMLEMM